VHANCARVPAFIGHAEYVNIETEKPISDTAAREILRHAKGISVVDHRANEGYATPAEVAGEDAVFVSRIRVDTSVENGLSFWCVADNLRKGAALNAVQIAEVLVKDYLGVQR
jgi:aspartate-semialdehyde dehydrogenase